MTHLQFRSKLATELIGSFRGGLKTGPISQFGRARKRNHSDGRPSVFNAVRLNNIGTHLPIKGTRRRCAHCSTKKLQQRSNIICKKCEVALCLECFLPYHQSS